MERAFFLEIPEIFPTRRIGVWRKAATEAVFILSSEVGSFFSIRQIHIVVRRVIMEMILDVLHGDNDQTKKENLSIREEIVQRSASCLHSLTFDSDQPQRNGAKYMRVRHHSLMEKVCPDEDVAGNDDIENVYGIAIVKEKWILDGRDEREIDALPSPDELEFHESLVQSLEEGWARGEM